MQPQQAEIGLVGLRQRADCQLHRAGLAVAADGLPRPGKLVFDLDRRAVAAAQLHQVEVEFGVDGHCSVTGFRVQEAAGQFQQGVGVGYHGTVGQRRVGDFLAAAQGPVRGGQAGVRGRIETFAHHHCRQIVVGFVAFVLALAVALPALGPAVRRRQGQPHILGIAGNRAVCLQPPYGRVGGIGVQLQPRTGGNHECPLFVFQCLPAR